MSDEKMVAVMLPASEMENAIELLPTDCSSGPAKVVYDAYRKALRPKPPMDSIGKLQAIGRYGDSADYSIRGDQARDLYAYLTYAMAELGDDPSE